MKEILQYQTKDGRVFNTAEAARDHETLVARIEAIMAPLGDTHPDVKDGKGWVQHDLETVNRAKDQIIHIGKEKGLFRAFDHIQRALGRELHPFSLAGRILDDHGGPLAHAWARFGRIDEQGREHQQPFYAYTNGPLPEHVLIEDRRRA
jgi:hypothetical protein